MVLLERPLLSCRLCSSGLYHTCTVSATEGGGHQKEQMLLLARTYEEHFTDSTGPSLPRDGRTFEALCVFPCVPQWLLKIQGIGLGSSGTLRLLLCFYSLPSLCI